MKKCVVHDVNHTTREIFCTNKLAKNLRRGAVKTKKDQRRNIIIIFLVCILIVSMPVSALAASQSGYHHQDWEGQYCLQAYDVTFSAMEIYELREENKLEAEILKRSRATAQVWETWEPVEGGFQAIELGILEQEQPLGEYPLTLYVNAGDRQTGYIEIKAYITGPEPTAEPPTEPPTETPSEPPTEPPTETPSEPPTETPSEPPTEAPSEPPTETPSEPSAGPTAMRAAAAGYETNAQPSPPKMTPEPIQEPTPKPMPQPSASPMPKALDTPAGEKTGEQTEQSEWTPFAIAAFGGAGAAAALLGISIVKDIQTIRWYNSKRKK